MMYVCVWRGFPLGSCQLHTKVISLHKTWLSPLVFKVEANLDQNTLGRRILHTLFSILNNVYIDSQYL